MNIFGEKMRGVGQIVAGISFVALVLGVFPVAAVAADEEVPVIEVAAEFVMETEPGDLCDNMLGVQLEVPEGWAADGSACYPVEVVELEPALETITVCKYDADRLEEETEDMLGIEGWTMFVSNTLSEMVSTEDEEYEVVTGADGCVTVEVDMNNGPWYVTEEAIEGWDLVDVVSEGGEVVDGEEFTYCEFSAPVIEAALAREVAMESSYACAFANYDNRELVSGYKWNDANNNGVKDEEEDGIKGWTITATDLSKLEFSDVEAETDVTGYYSMLLPRNGEWVVTEEDRSNWTQTAVYQNGRKLTTESEEGGSITECSFYLGEKVGRVMAVFEGEGEFLRNRCDFLNHQESRSGGTRVRERATPAPLVLGVSSSSPRCEAHLTSYLKMGTEASSTEVLKLQVFLNAVGIKAPLTGIFDAETDAAVRAFQMKHKAEVLTPWYNAKLAPDENPTGWVYKLTRWKINNTVCPGSEAYPVLN